MKIVSEIEKRMGDLWIPRIYEDKVRSQRTRSHSLDVLEKENDASIQHTLLGIELRVGKKRFSSPDLSSARYLQIFARIGCNNFAVPYDITKISSLADEMETSWQNLLLLLEKRSKTKTPQMRGRMRAAVVREMRVQIDKIGPGRKIPEFKKTTKQRKN